MGNRQRIVRLVAGTTLVAGLALVGPWGARAADEQLTGRQEVPAVATTATGEDTITVHPDHTVTGTVTTTGMQGTAAHIHEAAPGKSGPVIVPLQKTGDNTWSVPAGTKLTNQQYAAYQAGDLYVNVHTAAHPNGEIRTQLRPQG